MRPQLYNQKAMDCKGKTKVSGKTVLSLKVILFFLNVYPTLIIDTVPSGCMALYREKFTI